MLSSQDMDKSWISLLKWDKRYGKRVISFLEYPLANTNGNTIFYCPCTKCQCRSDMHRFEIDKVRQHLKSNGFGRSTHVGYITIKHHQGVRMIISNFLRRAVHPTIQQRPSSTICFLMRAVYALKDRICLSRCSPSLELSTLLVLTGTISYLLSNRPLCTPVVKKRFLKV